MKIKLISGKTLTGCIIRHKQRFCRDSIYICEKGVKSYGTPLTYFMAVYAIIARKSQSHKIQSVASDMGAFMRYGWRYAAFVRRVAAGFDKKCG